MNGLDGNLTSQEINILLLMQLGEEIKKQLELLLKSRLGKMLVGSKKIFGKLTLIKDLSLLALELINRVIASIIQKSNQNFSDTKTQTIDYMISSPNSSTILHESKEINTYQSATIQYNPIDVYANNNEATIKILSNMYEQDLMEQWRVSADDKRGIAVAKVEAERMARTQYFDTELTAGIIGSGNNTSDEIAQQIYNKVKQRQQDAVDAMEAIKQENEKYKYYYNEIDRKEAATKSLTN